MHCKVGVIVILKQAVRLERSLNISEETVQRPVLIETFTLSLFALLLYAFCKLIKIDFSHFPFLFFFRVRIFLEFTSLSLYITSNPQPSDPSTTKASSTVKSVHIEAHRTGEMYFFCFSINICLYQKWVVGTNII